MLLKLLVALCLLAITVTIHAAGLAAILRRRLLSPAVQETRFWPVTWLLVRVASGLILIHLAEIAVWALFYWTQECLSDAESSFYFSSVTYTTVGYGDLVLPEAWRMLGPVEGLTGILMCGLSASVFFTVVTRIYSARAAASGRARP